jgi:hypothetical protein
VSSKNKTDLLSAIMLQIFWPFGGFLFSFNKNFKEQTTFIYILIAGFYGFVFVPTPESDMIRYLEEFSRLAELDYRDLYGEVIGGSFSDYYTVVLSFVISIFTDDPRIYLAAACMIFSVFYLKSIEMVTREFSNSNKLVNALLLFLLYFYVPIFFINGLRFYTAFYVFFFGVLKIFFDQKTKYILLILITPLIHLSFISVVIIYLLFYFFGKSRWFSVALLILSFGFSLTSFDFSIFTGENKAQQKILNYTTTESVNDFYDNLNEMRATTNQKYKIYEFVSDLHYYFVLVVFILIFINKYKLLQLFDNYNHKLINFNIILLSLVYFMQNVPESYRFKHIFVMFLLYSIVLIRKINPLDFNLNRIVWLMIISLFPYVLMTNYICVLVITKDFYFSNWILELFINN